MKILLIGPCPPPHGGISVHVAGVYRRLNEANVPCRILDPSRTSYKLSLGLTMLWFSLRGWTLHVHTNGHNGKSWTLVLACGLAGLAGRGCLLTLHSGMAPRYLESLTIARRRMVALVCSLYRRIVCVSPAIQQSVLSLGVPFDHTEVAPAFLEVERPRVSLDPQLLAWMHRRRPLFSTVLFFRPEYGFELLIAAFSRLRRIHPLFGCLVIGNGEQRKEAVRKIREANLENNLRLLGDVAHDTCLECIARSDVFIRATLADGDSISVREALALGVATVASRVGFRPEGVIQFRPGDADDLLAKIELALVHTKVAS